MTFPLTYVVPVHQEAAILEAQVARLQTALVSYPGSMIFLVENGSQDGSAALVARLENPRHSIPVYSFSMRQAGIGFAYDRGIREALTLDGPDATRWLVLTAADLPFGMHDLIHALPHLVAPTGPLLIGSKAHPESTCSVQLDRILATRIYRYARRLVANMRTGDSQGSLFLRLDVAARFVDLIQARDFFYSTELVFHMERLHHPIVEIPVVVEPEVRVSTVRPFKHGVSMLRALGRLVATWGRVK